MENTSGRLVKLFLRGNERVFTHPSSLLHGTPSYRSPFLLYTSKLQTDRQYILKMSMISPLALFFSAGVIDILHEHSKVVLDGWICLSASPRVSVLLNELKKELEKVLMEKLCRPEMDVSASVVLSAMKELIESEEIERSFVLS